MSWKILGTKILIVVSLAMAQQKGLAQNNSYVESIKAYQSSYVNNHEVVKPPDRKFIRFYPISSAYRVKANFRRIIDRRGFYMVTATGVHQKFYKYGLLSFRVKGVPAHLYVYQSDDLLKQPKLKDYLFVPFGDATSGVTSYGGGRYLDFRVSDIKNGILWIDFNKAYNPYCAYTTGYDCPLPPKENLLSLPIRAGEENYGKPVHH
ncbi:MAG: DUF1684 domain-containing protein [Bacteroidota bacterium]|nr:DUF1684 domain-containing protein [Bacteroidota bacterium]